MPESMGVMDNFAPSEAAALGERTEGLGKAGRVAGDGDPSFASDRVDAILERGDSWRDWPDAIAQRYSDTATQRFYQEQHFLFMLGLLSCLATIAIDYLIAPSVAQDGFVYRVLAVCPITLLGLYAASRRWTLLTKICLTAAPSAFIAVLVVLAVTAMPEDTAKYLSAMPLIVGLANIVMPFTMRGLFVFDCTLILTAIATLVLSSPFPLVAYLEYVVLLTVVAFSTLPIALRFERLRQRNFLLNLRAETTSHELRAANERLQALSDRDHLTGLANRRCFDRVFDELIEQRAHKSLATDVPPSRIAMLMIDLDHFKAFNDTYGHTSGDECLRIVGHELASIIEREDGVVARYGGEEFVATLCEETPGAVARVAEEIRQRISTMLVPVAPSGRSIVTTSIGIALSEFDGDVNRQHLIKTADAALYNAKRAGRNRVEAIELGPESAKLRA
ncbi:MAG: diguanylate cyclase [Erythrobacter sp.]|nr:diguanylate cyclase [Erythrobacter sp.]